MGALSPPEGRRLEHSGHGLCSDPDSGQGGKIEDPGPCLQHVSGRGWRSEQGMWLGRSAPSPVAAVGESRGATACTHMAPTTLVSAP